MAGHTKAHLQLLRRPLLRDIDCNLNKDFLRLCWIDEDDKESPRKTNVGQIKDPSSYIDWLFNIGRSGSREMPRVSTPEAVSEDLSDSLRTCSSPSVATSVLAFHNSDSTASGVSTEHLGSPPSWKSGRTPPAVYAPRQCRASRRIECRSMYSAPRIREPSAMLRYYIWQQQQSADVAASRFSQCPHLQ